MTSSEVQAILVRLASIDEKLQSIPGRMRVVELLVVSIIAALAGDVAGIAPF
jgi:hypothetical protein